MDDPRQPYSFRLLLNRTNKLLRAWISTVFESPTLVGISPSNEGAANSAVAIKKESGQAQALKKLQRSRARLKDHVEDPLSDAVAAATYATRKQKKRTQNQSEEKDEDDEDDEESDEDSNETERAFIGRNKINKNKRRRMSPIVRGSILDKKKSAKSLDFTPEEGSDSENIEDLEEQEDVLSEVKIRIRPEIKSPKKRKSQEKMYEGRRIWEDIEKNAVIDGIIRLGLGKWAEIKRTEVLILRNRTSGQIKVRFDILSNTVTTGCFKNGREWVVWFLEYNDVIVS